MKRYINKLFAIALAGTMVLSFCGCGKKNQPKPVESPQTQKNSATNSANPTEKSDKKADSSQATPDVSGAVDAATGLTVSDAGVCIYNTDKYKVYLNKFSRSTDDNIVDVKCKDNSGSLCLYVAGNNTSSINVDCTSVDVNNTNCSLESKSSISGASGYCVFYWFNSPNETEKVAINSLKVSLKLTNDKGESVNTDLIELKDAIGLLNGSNDLSGKDNDQVEASKMTPEPSPNKDGHVSKSENAAKAPAGTTK